MSDEAATLALAKGRRIGRFDRIEDLIGKSDRKDCAAPDVVGAPNRASEEENADPT